MNGFINLNPDLRAINITFDEPQVEELEAYPAYAGKLKKCQTVNMKNMSDFPHLHHHTWRHMDGFDMVNMALQMGFQYAIVWADGSWPTDDDFNEKLMEEIEFWDEDDIPWLCAGHLIARHGQLPHFHQQCVVINLKEWETCKRPDLDQYHLKFWPNFIKSKETINSKYTPLWIGPNNELSLEDQHKGMDLGSDGWEANFLDALIPQAIRNGRKVWNLSYEIRNTKICVYPEDDIESTIEWLMDTEYSDKYKNMLDINNAKFQLPEDKRDLYTLKSLDHSIMYITNTESIPRAQWAAGKPIDTLIVPASGLNQFEYMLQTIDTIKTVNWMDFSKYGIGWTKHVLENWDGRDFKQFVKDNIHIIDEMGFPDNGVKNFSEKNADAFEQAHTEEEWLAGWDRIRNLEHNFMQLDVVKQWDQIVKAAGENNTVHLQLSNIYQYEINYLNTPLFEAQENFVKMINAMMRNNNVVYFSGDTPGGLYYDYADVRLLPGII